MNFQISYSWRVQKHPLGGKLAEEFVKFTKSLVRRIRQSKINNLQSPIKQTTLKNFKTKQNPNSIMNNEIFDKLNSIFETLIYITEIITGQHHESLYNF